MFGLGPMDEVLIGMSAWYCFGMIACLGGVYWKEGSIQKVIALIGVSGTVFGIVLMVNGLMNGGL